jgi:hypothetical protein
MLKSDAESRTCDCMFVVCVLCQVFFCAATNLLRAEDFFNQYLIVD